MGRPSSILLIPSTFNLYPQQSSSINHRPAVQPCKSPTNNPPNYTGQPPSVYTHKPPIALTVPFALNGKTVKLGESVRSQKAAGLRRVRRMRRGFGECGRIYELGLGRGLVAVLVCC
mmetsp:Transcript_10448/g.19548  ORF Transcript_10448/g.19548 Transcript_10448/m.19548 type:complete len:117 (+) Transcript_10448:6658-7008(+)